jgi:hypothetical protein
MKLKDLKEAEEIVEVSIGYDDHCSVYAITKRELKSCSKMTNADDINDFITKNGKRLNYKKPCESGEIFFDYEFNDISEFRSQINEAEDMSELDPMTINEIEKKIREGAKDPEQKWANALELVHKAYAVLNIQRPTPEMGAGWKQYEALIEFAVKELSKTRGLDADWRMSAPSMK